MIQEDEDSSIVRFFVSKKKKDLQLTLVPDTDYNNCYNFYSTVDGLTEDEISNLLQEVIEYIPENYYISCIGFQSEETIKLFKLLTFNTKVFKDTNCVKIVRHNYSYESICLPILLKI